MSNCVQSMWLLHLVRLCFSLSSPIVTPWIERSASIEPQLLHNSIIGVTPNETSKFWVLSGKPSKSDNATYTNYYSSIDIPSGDVSSYEFHASTLTQRTRIECSSQCYSTLHHYLYFIHSQHILAFNMQQTSLHPITIIPEDTASACLAGSTDGYLFLLGGVRNQNEYLKSLHIYNLKTRQWNVLSAPSMLTSRADFSCNVVGDYLYAIGGQTTNTQKSNSVERLYIADMLNVDDYSWSTADSTLSTAKSKTRSVVFRDKYIFVIGGNDENSAILNEIDVITTSPNEVRISPSIDLPLSARFVSAAVHIANDVLYVFTPSKQYHSTITLTNDSLSETAYFHSEQSVEIFDETNHNRILWQIGHICFAALFSFTFLYSFCLLIPFMTNKGAFQPMKYKEILIIVCMNITSCLEMCLCVHLSTAVHWNVAQATTDIFLQLITNYLYFITISSMLYLSTIPSKSIPFKRFRHKQRCSIILVTLLLITHCLLLMLNWRAQIIFIIDTSWSLLLFLIVTITTLYVCMLKRVPNIHGKPSKPSRPQQCAEWSSDFMHNEIESLSCITVFALLLSVTFLSVQSITSVYFAINYQSQPITCWFVGLCVQFLTSSTVCILYGHQLQFIRKKFSVSAFLCDCTYNQCPFMYNTNKWDDKYWDELSKQQRATMEPRSTFDLPNLGIYAGRTETVSLSRNRTSSLPMYKMSSITTMQRDTSSHAVITEETSNFQTHILNSVVLNEFAMEDVVHEIATDKDGKTDVEDAEKQKRERYNKLSIQLMPEQGVDPHSHSYVDELLRLHSNDDEDEHDMESASNTSDSDSDPGSDHGGEAEMKPEGVVAGTDGVDAGDLRGDEEQDKMMAMQPLDEDEEEEEDGETTDSNDENHDENQVNRFEAHLRYTRKLSEVKQKCIEELLMKRVSIPIEPESTDHDNLSTDLSDAHLST